MSSFLLNTLEVSFINMFFKSSIPPRPNAWTTPSQNYRPRKSISLRSNPKPRPNGFTLSSSKTFDKELGKKLPLRLIVAEDNSINRGVLVNMLKRLVFSDILEAVDGVEAVGVMKL